MTDKRTDSQFKGLKPLPTIDTGEGVPPIHHATGTPAIGPAREGRSYLNVEENPYSPYSFIGGAASRMQAISQNARESEFDPKYRDLAKVAGGKWRAVDTKSGRSKLSKDLGLPNKKELKAKKKK